MIILSQDGKSLWNMDNAISVEVHGSVVKLYEPQMSSSIMPHILGTYKNEGRALAVLAEIFSYFEPVTMMLGGGKAEITPAIMKAGVMTVSNDAQTEIVRPLSYRMPPE